MWTDFFDHIYLINLKKRTDRLLQAKWELDKYSIPYEVCEANEREDGRLGIFLSLHRIMKDAFLRQYKNILVFEDDVVFLANPSEVMPLVLKYLPLDYDILYLGANLTKGYIPSFHSSNLLRLPRGFALHGCAYSAAGIDKMWRLEPTDLPVDMAIADKIQPDGNCYAAYPMVCTQRPGFSDIEKKETNWKYALEDRFYERTKNTLYERKVSKEDTP